MRSPTVVGLKDGHTDPGPTDLADLEKVLDHGLSLVGAVRRSA